MRLRHRIPSTLRCVTRYTVHNVTKLRARVQMVYRRLTLFVMIDKMSAMFAHSRLKLLRLHNIREVSPCHLTLACLPDCLECFIHDWDLHLNDRIIIHYLTRPRETRAIIVSVGHDTTHIYECEAD